MSDTHRPTTPTSADDSPHAMNTAAGGSIDRALAGEARWSINDVLGEAWEKQNGMKLSFWLAMIMYMIIIGVLSYVLELVLGAEAIGAVVAQVVIGLVSYPMVAGFAMMGVKRAAGQPISATMIFDYYGRTLPIFLLNLVMFLLIAIGLMLLVVPGIYLMIAYGMAIPLLVDKNMGIWEALETSRKAMTKCWFRYFGLMLLMMLIIMISAIPLGLGLIWTMPTLVLVVGVVYRDLFGVEASAEEAATAQVV